MKIAIASDHAAFELKQFLIKWLSTKGHKVNDFGTDSEESVDYPDYAFEAAKSVSEQNEDFGIIICGSGIGMSIVSNKVPGIRAALCCTEEMAKLSRQHNNANVLNLGARLIDKETAINIIETFFDTEFDAGRHQRRIDKIQTLTNL